MSSRPIIPLNLDVLAVKPQWLCGTFAFHPMLGFSRKKQTESIAHGCASTICAVADHFDPGNKAHAVDVGSLRKWALGRGHRPGPIARSHAARSNGGALGFGPASLSDDEQKQGCCWFRRADPKIGQTSRLSVPSQESRLPPKARRSAPNLHKIYLACGRRNTHEARRRLTPLPAPSSGACARSDI